MSNLIFLIPMTLIFYFCSPAIAQNSNPDCEGAKSILLFNGTEMKACKGLYVIDGKEYGAPEIEIDADGAGKMHGFSTNEFRFSTELFEKQSEFYAIWILEFERGTPALPAYFDKITCETGKRCIVRQHICSFSSSVNLPTPIVQHNKFSERAKFSCVAGQAPVTVEIKKTKIDIVEQNSQLSRPIVAYFNGTTKYPRSKKVKGEPANYLQPSFVKIGDKWFFEGDLDAYNQLKPLYLLDREEFLPFIDPESLVKVIWPSAAPFALMSNPYQWNPDKKLSWSYVYDGKVISRTETKIVSKYGFEILKFKEQSPEFEKIRKRQGGFILASNRNEVKDPESWHRGEPPAAIVDRVKEAHLKTFPLKRTCIESELQDTKVALKSADLKIVPRAFVSKSGNWLLGIKINTPRGRGCMSTVWFGDKKVDLPPYYQTTWYAVIGSKLISINGSHDEWEPMEAADFDGDGKSEWIFRCPSDFGLRLYWNDFEQWAENYRDWG